MARASRTLDAGGSNCQPERGGDLFQCGAGICDADCSLREAIAAANALTSDDVITFSVNGTFTLTNGELSIANNGTLTINGNGAAQPIVSGNNASRVFTINSGVTAALNGLTIANGNLSSAGTNQGSGILNRGV